MSARKMIGRRTYLFIKLSLLLSICGQEKPQAAVAGFDDSHYPVLLAQGERAKPLLKGEIGETQAESRKKADDFEKLYATYRAARALYLEHKQLYDQHVAQFHNQPPQMISPSSAGSDSDNKAIPAPPPFKPLKRQAGDAYLDLQREELLLSKTESKLVESLNNLMNTKGKIDPDTYSQQWQEAQSLATSLQSRVMAFGRDVLTKEQISRDELHNLTQAAIRDGDYVESRKVCLDAQRQAQLDNEEITRAHAHSTTYARLLTELNRLTPLLNSAQQQQAPTFITFEQLRGESEALQEEYESLQVKYRELQLFHRSAVRMP